MMKALIREDSGLEKHNKKYRFTLIDNGYLNTNLIIPICQLTEN